MNSKSLLKISRNNQGERKTIKYFDYGLLAMIILILVFGLVMLYSTSAYTASTLYNDPAHFLKRQAAAAAVGFAGMMFISYIPYKIWARFAVPIYVIALVLCVAVNFVGTDMGTDSSRWFRIGPITFQPSELAKIAAIVFIASLVSDTWKRMKNTVVVIVSFAVMLPLVISIAITNLSTAVVVMGIVFIMLFVASPKKKVFAMLTGGGAAIIAFYIMAAGYRGRRVMIWLHPEDFDEGFQTMQGLYAIGAGGLFGKGLGGSVQKLGVLPVAQNDMIFAIICEELGVFGAICVIVLYLILLWRLLYIANHAKDMLGSFLVLGIMAHLAIQVILNIAVVTNSMPNTGVILPLISYGGTSVMLLLWELGIALSVARGIPME